ncbi:transcriptional regulator, TraR/DksA family [Paucidesulfovibrio gracilis DSM 16080]|uniref:Transcriptional regulator, TraR/DksA family n=1 Tax=Paucidesulfovibrio gracilis DSM 16080 TaxID=1121449 RepID=A0A1T4X6P5_9BACT|nr:TraR/DksA C4-type zinc finger protein [Paucidesulfovibrio gracilis]SKA85303.1 transcriptional regulator, TraR/DksA family [Paucidesulfovibrio gracilis DSM 16080]
MNDADRDRMKRCLAEEMERCRAEIARLETTADPVAVDSAVGRLSRMDTLVNQGVSGQSLSKARRRLLLLDRALRNADYPGFGECVECGNPIPVKRLLLVPETEYCVHCAPE